MTDRASAGRPPAGATPLYQPARSAADGLAGAVLRQLLFQGVIPADAWGALPGAERERVLVADGLPALAEALVARRLLTPYQAGRVRAGVVNGLVLGNFRVLERVGSGGMGVVFRAEHQTFRTPAAIKALLHVDEVKNRRSIERFFVEVRAVAGLKHPNIVAAIDAGVEPQAGPDGQSVPYFVMEYLTGRNADDLVSQDGPLGVARACQFAHQVADALTEAHRHGLVHRDIKPSNIMLTADGAAKLLDFGVARLPSESRLTQDGARLGTVGYMAPEQARNPRDVDGRADVFGLAATLFFALTGQDPFAHPAGGGAPDSPPSLREFRADAPAGLDEALKRMMAFDPERRTRSAAEAMRELAPYAGWDRGPAPSAPPAAPPGTRTLVAGPAAAPPPEAIPAAGAPSARMPSVAALLNGVAPAPDKLARKHRVLIVDDDDTVRRVCRLALRDEPVECEEVSDGAVAAARGLSAPWDLILLDVDLPGLTGEQVLRKLRQNPQAAHTKVVMLSGRTSGDDLSRLLSSGADDYLTKPFSLVQLRARVKAALKLKSVQDRTDVLTRRLAASNADLERALTSKDGEIVHTRSAMVLALAKLVEQRSAETGQHLIRLQRYCRVLAEAASALPAFRGRLDPVFVQAVEEAAPLHDIGKVAVPDAVLNKPGRLTPEELTTMQAHTTAGADTLSEVSKRYPFFTGFFDTAVEIARHHHERYDGSGYPDRLVGEAIPVSARLVALGDVYDALRSRRVYKPAFPHDAAVNQMLAQSPGHFDPALLGVFGRVAPEFDRIFRDAAD